MLNSFISIYTLPTLLLLFLLIPFSLFTYIALVGRLIGSRNLFFFVLINLSIEWILFFLLFDSVILTGNTIEFSLYSWIDLYEGLEINFILDTLGIEMGFVILLISTCVILYSFDYLSADPHLMRFVCYLHLFLFFMLVIVTSGNLLQFFIGWEGVGIVSFLLINFWFTRLEANRSAIKAVIFNKVGDIGYLVAIVLIFLRVGSLDFTIINSFDWLEPSLITADMVVLFLFIGAMGKSAQLGLHAWLPDAMEGPTPVSALLHSATMVTVGIFVLLRTSPIINSSLFMPFVITLIGSLTCLVAAIFAYFQDDIKKVIAYSTCSQLGLMVTSIGTFNYAGCFFHLTTHAFFKALLFLTAGVIIHALSNEQDVRKMGGLFNYMPITALTSIIGTLGLIGFPFFAGFYSKEFIILWVWNCDSFINHLAFINLLLGSMLTILYSLRLVFMVFFTRYRGSKVHLHYVGDSVDYVNVILATLAFFTLFFGYFFRDTYIGVGTNIWEGIFDYRLEYIDQYFETETTPFLIKNLLFFFTIVLFIIFKYWSLFTAGWYVLAKSFILTRFQNGEKVGFLKSILIRVLYRTYSFFSMKFWLSTVHKIVVDTYLYTAYRVLVVKLDKGVFEDLFVITWIRFLTSPIFDHVGRVKSLEMGLNFIIIFITLIVVGVVMGPDLINFINVGNAI